MLILVVPFDFVQQINNNLYALDILCLDNFYFAGVPRIILFSHIPHMSSQVTFIYIALLTIQIVTKQLNCTISKWENSVNNVNDKIKHSIFS